MAYWFHRNPLKATAATNFDLKMVVIDSEAVKMRDELRVARAALLDIISNPSNSVEELESKSNHYLSLLQGLILPLEDTGGGESKMRFTLRFRWTNTVLGRIPSARQDTHFELASILQNLALWYMKHASVLAGKDDISMDQAKEIHRLLRKAAGIFTFVQEKQASVLSAERPEPGSDLDPQVMSAYITQCSAEAQEVAIARAVELKHSSSLVSSLAAETSKMFSTAETSLGRLDPTKFGKWQLYLRLKSVFYLSLAYCHCGESLLAQEKCGDAVRALQESQTLYQEAAGKLCTDYVKSKGPGMSARPQDHPFFRKLGPTVTRTLEKCVRENGFIYHQKVADKPPQLETKASYGIANPEPYQLPDLSPKWTPTCYAAFVGVRLQPTESKAAVAAEGELPPVAEKDVQHSEKEPKNTSGCVLQ